jgi:hypothetical protein
MMLDSQLVAEPKIKFWAEWLINEILGTSINYIN